MDLPDQLQCDYLAEGAANIVYRITHVPPVRKTSDASGPPPSPPVTADFHALPPLNSSSTPPPTSITPQISRSLSQPEPSWPASSIPRALTLEEPYPLLRVRKALTHLSSNKDQFDRISSLLQPLLPPNTIIRHRLVSLPAHLRDNLNDSLRADEASGARPLSRHGSYIATDEPHAMLVQDMTPTPHGYGLQLKPKWLVQSPNAPRTARRCRTCALREMREFEYRQGKRLSRPKQSTSFCPLDLASGRHDGVERAVDAVLQPSLQMLGAADSSRASFLPYVRDLFVDFLLKSPILLRLRDLQHSLDTKGILSIHDEADISQDFQLATTLRDCSLFIRATWMDGKDEDDDLQNADCEATSGARLSWSDPFAAEAAKKRPHVEGLLGDLDLKRPERDKLHYWSKTEEALIQGGWYDGRAAVASRESSMESNARLCRLERA